MTPQELKKLVEERGSRFFSPANMKFSGDTMENYGVRKTKIKTRQGDTIEVWCLYRKKPVKWGIYQNAYFSTEKPYKIQHGEEIA